MNKQIIYDINLQFLQSVERRFPKDRDMLARVSIIEESQPQMIRMAYLAIIGSHKVNGVAELHSDLIKSTIFKDFVAIYGPDKFTNVTNGITPRRWLHQANPKLSDLIASKLGGYEFLRDLTLIHKIEQYANDKDFKKEWSDIKYANKVRLAKHIMDATGVSVNPKALFDVQVKRIHEYKRQQLNIFGVISRYLSIKAMSAEEKKKLTPRVSIFGGKAAPGYWMAKTIIHLVNKVGDVVNKDKDVGDLLKVIFVPDYNVSKAEIITPASDISEHISTAGTEASGTSNMKFVLNGGLIIGTCDGANVSFPNALFLPLYMHTNILFRLKSPVKLVIKTSSSLAILLKMSKTSVTITTMGNTNSTLNFNESSKPSNPVPLVIKPPSLLLFRPSGIMEITISFRMTSIPTLKPTN